MRNPFKALDSYDEDDSDIFFGRDKEKLNLYNHVTQNVLTVVCGKSGVGKSSIINAGLVPVLRKNFAPVKLRTLSLIESQNCVKSIIQLVIEVSIKNGIEIIDTLSGSSYVNSENITLWEFFHRTTFKDLNGKTNNPILVFDQFEEIFTSGISERGFFKENVEELITEIAALVEDYVPKKVSSKEVKDRQFDFLRFREQESNCKILFILRSDYLSELEALTERIPQISMGFNRFLIKPFTHEQAHEVLQNVSSNLFDEVAQEKIIDILSGYKESGENVTKSNIDPFILSLYCYNLVENNKVLLETGKKIGLSEIKQSNWDYFLNEFYARNVKLVSSNTRRLIEDQLLSKGNRLIYSLSRAVNENKIKEKEIDLLVSNKIINSTYYAGHKYIELVHDILIKPVQATGTKRRRHERRINMFLASLIMILLCSGGIYLYNQSAKKEDRIGLVLLSTNQKLENTVSDLEKYKYVHAATMSIYEDRDAISAIQNSKIAYSLDSTLPLVIKSVYNSFKSGGVFYKSINGKYPIRYMDLNYNRIAIAIANDTVAIYDLLGKEVSRFKTKYQIKSILLFKNSDKILIGTNDGFVDQYSFEGKLIKSFDIKERKMAKKRYAFKQAILMEDSGLLATCYGKVFKLTDFKGRFSQLVQTPKSFDTIQKIAVSKYSNTIGIASYNIVSLYRFTFDSLTKITELVHPNNVIDISFSPTQDIVITSCDDNVARVFYSTNKFSTMNVSKINHNSEELNISRFTPDGEYIVTGSNHNIRLWDVNKILKSNELINLNSRDRTMQTLPSSSGCIDIEFYYTTDSSKYLLSYSDDYTIRRWNINKPNLDAIPLRKHQGTVYKASFINSRNSIISVSQDKKAIIWKINENGLEDSKIPSSDSLETKVLIDNDGGVISYTDQKSISIIDPSSYATTRIKHHSHSSFYRIRKSNEIFSFSVDSMLIRSNDLFWIYNSKKDTCYQLNIKKNLKPVAQIEYCKLSFDKNYLLIVSKGYRGGDSLLIYDLKNGSFFKSTKYIKENKVTNMKTDFIPGTNTVVYSNSNTIVIWNFATDSVKRLTCDKVSSTVKATEIKVSNDGKHLVAGFNNKALIFWILNGNEAQLDTVVFSKGKITSIFFAKSSDKFVTSSNDDKVIVWLTNGNKVLEMKTNEGTPQQVFFVEDDSKIMFKDNNSAITFWDTNIKRLIKKWNWSDF